MPKRLATEDEIRNRKRSCRLIELAEIEDLDTMGCQFAVVPPPPDHVSDTESESDEDVAGEIDIIAEDEEILDVKGLQWEKPDDDEVPDFINFGEFRNENICVDAISEKFYGSTCMNVFEDL